MVLDIDNFIKDTFEDDPDRIFPYDLFLSHRQFDLPHDLFKKLTEFNIKYIWDYDLNLSDRRVLQQVSRAMRHSRYLGLYVSENYIDSLWCAAEYLSGLATEKQFKVERVLVILENLNSTNHIPFPLINSARILLSENGMQSLINLVRLGNKNEDQNTQGIYLKRFGVNHLGLNIDLLAVDEKLLILEQRLRWWYQTMSIVNLSQKEKEARIVMSLMGEPFSEIELIARELSGYVLQKGMNLQAKVGVSDSSFNYIISIAELVGASLINPVTQPESLNASKWLYDFMLMPLLLVISSNENSEKAVSAYRLICEGLRFSVFKKEVPIYLQVLDESLKNRKNVNLIINEAKFWLLNANN